MEEKMQEITPQQILLPKKVFIGDIAELRCTFNSPEAELKELISQGPVKISSHIYTSDFEIKDIQLYPAGVDFYQLSITFVPWKTGDLLFPPLKIEEADVTILFQPVNIVSLLSTDEKNPTALQETRAPLLLPGTSYKLYGILAAVLIIMIITIQLIVKRKSLFFYIQTKKLLKKYRKNKKAVIKVLRQLINNSNSDSKENTLVVIC